MTTSISTVGQANKFEELADNMFFKIRVFEADSTTLGFIKRYIPFLANRPKRGGWSAYPPNADTTEPQLVLHAFHFDKHPYADFKFSQGRLDVYTRERENKAIGLYDYQLWFMFDNKDDADITFDKLSEMFDIVSTSKNIFERNNKKIAAYKNDKANVWTNEVQFVLTQDELYDNKYKILFRIGVDELLSENYGIQQ